MSTMMNIMAFDVDNTLLIERDGHVIVNEDVRDLMVAVHKLGLARIVVWSGGGADYARMATRDCGIHHMVWKYAAKTDGTDALLTQGSQVITVDDQPTTLGTVNLTLAGDIAATPWMAAGRTSATDLGGLAIRIRYLFTGEDSVEREVSKAEWVRLEHDIGNFCNTQGHDGVEPATMSWSAKGVSGRQEYVTERSRIDRPKRTMRDLDAD